MTTQSSPARIEPVIVRSKPFTADCGHLIPVQSRRLRQPGIAVVITMRDGSQHTTCAPCSTAYGGRIRFSW